VVTVLDAKCKMTSLIFYSSINPNRESLHFFDLHLYPTIPAPPHSTYMLV